MVSVSVELKRFEPEKIISIRKLSTEEKLYNDSQKALEQLVQHMLDNDGVLAGDFFTINHNPEYNPNFIDVEFCIVVDELLPQTAIIKSRETQEFVAACIDYEGDIKGVSVLSQIIDEYLTNSKIKKLNVGKIERFSIEQSFDESNVQIQVIQPIDENDI